MFRPAYVPGIPFEHAGITPCMIANVLDGLSITPTGAYSTRRLLSTYMGPALQVWRQSDGHTMDIGFDTNCNLDSAALLSFCSGTNCNISAWYDQSGNGNHLTSFAGNSSQTPRIVTVGAPAVTVNGHIASVGLAPSAGGNDLAKSVNPNFVPPMFGASQGALFAVGNAASGGTPAFGVSWQQLPCMTGCTDGFSGNNNMLGLSFAQTAAAPVTLVPSLVSWRLKGGFFVAMDDIHAEASYTFGTNASFALRYNTADTPNVTKAYVNGGTPGVSADTSTSNSPNVNFVIGGGGNSARQQSFLGTIAEVIAFGTELSLVDSNILGANMALYWGLPAWGTITV